MLFYNKSKLIIVMILAIGLIGKTTLGSEKETIQWYIFEFPPVFIKTGKLAGQGWGTKTLSILQENLPEYNHERRWASVKRIYADMEQGVNICSHATAPSPKREKIAYFSKNVIGQTQRIIMRQAVYDQHFPNQGRLSLESLLRDTSLKLGVAQGRSFGPIITPIIEKYRNTDNVFDRGGVDLSGGLIKMLASERIDYVIEYSWVFNFIKKDAGLDAQFKVIDIGEVKNLEDQFVFGGTACTKNAWGKQMIRKINKISLQKHEANRTLIEEWFSPEEIPAFREAWESLIVKPLRDKVQM